MLNGTYRQENLVEVYNLRFNQTIRCYLLIFFHYQEPKSFVRTLRSLKVFRHSLVSACLSFCCIRLFFAQPVLGVSKYCAWCMPLQPLEGFRTTKTITFLFQLPTPRYQSRTYHAKYSHQGSNLMDFLALCAYKAVIQWRDLYCSLFGTLFQIPLNGLSFFHPLWPSLRIYFRADIHYSPG